MINLGNYSLSRRWVEGGGTVAVLKTEIQISPEDAERIFALSGDAVPRAIEEVLRKIFSNE